ncbi:hypothetical protein M3N55_15330 [Roseibaca sp. V10]|uniref:Uncharacterized protein n=1 Tax=Roseinatronobacter domitianus TaxID=2940293 RepID=A0ABT0M626_9RHOB|nr:hypothetical protein [Roseibaca domitiana]MCL1630098.1 hypothetical protein [Roseibaca domitiana]
MSDDTSGKSLVPLWNTGLVSHGREGNKLIRRAASDALIPMYSLINQQESILHRVGTHEFHDEDFRQLQVWASELGMDGQISEFVDAFDKFFMDLVSKRDIFVIGVTNGNLAEWPGWPEAAYLGF